MRRVHIWVFCINLLGGFQLLFAQQEETTISIAEVDSLEINEKVPLSLRFGIDLYRIVLSQATDDFNGFEAVGDLRLGENFFLATEVGTIEKTKQIEQLNITTSGSYYKLGFDYNMYENWKGMNNHVTIGLRFATSSHKQLLNSYTILDRTRFWPGSDLPITAGFATGERANLNAQWLEIAVGFKVELLKNIYMGLSLRLNRLLSDKIPENLDNVYIPGFNKKTEDNKFGAGFNYTLTYNIPFTSKRN